MQIVLKFFCQDPVDRLAGFKQGLGGCLNFFKQGPVEIFYAESAQKILIKVCLKNFMQDLVDLRESLTTSAGSSGSGLMQIRLTFINQSLLKIFQARSG